MSADGMVSGINNSSIQSDLKTEDNAAAFKSAAKPTVNLTLPDGSKIHQTGNSDKKGQPVFQTQDGTNLSCTGEGGSRHSPFYSYATPNGGNFFYSPGAFGRPDTYEYSASTPGSHHTQVLPDQN